MYRFRILSSTDTVKLDVISYRQAHFCCVADEKHLRWKTGEGRSAMTSAVRVLYCHLRITSLLPFNIKFDDVITCQCSHHRGRIMVMEMVPGNSS